MEHRENKQKLKMNQWKPHHILFHGLRLVRGVQADSSKQK